MSSTPQRVLITGAFGYVGARLARHLAADPQIDLVLGSRRARSVPSWASRARVVLTDFGAADSLRAVCADADAVVHLAGANARESAADPVLALEVNALATARLAVAAVAAGVTRLIYVSTAHVYGSPLRGRIDEDTCPRGPHPYATSHRAGEEAVLQAKDKLSAVAIRLSNSFGVPVDGAADCWSLLVNDLCWQAATTRRLRLTTPGLQRRDFVTLADTCAALEHLLTLPAVEGLFNVGGAWAPTVREMATRIAQLCPAVLGYEVALEMPAAEPGAQPDDLDYRIDKLLATGFRPTDLVERELAATLEFCAARVRAVEH